VILDLAAIIFVLHLDILYKNLTNWNAKTKGIKMALTEKIDIDRVEVVTNGIVQVRQSTTIYKDGGELVKSFHRWVLTPGQDVSDQAANVQAICQAAWTPEVIAAYQAQLEANRLGA
jgi:hypothetical protein